MATRTFQLYITCLRTSIKLPPTYLLLDRSINSYIHNFCTSYFRCKLGNHAIIQTQKNISNYRCSKTKQPFPEALFYHHCHMVFKQWKCNILIEQFLFNTYLKKDNLYYFYFIYFADNWQLFFICISTLKCHSLQTSFY